MANREMHSRNIRYLLLLILREQRRLGKAESGGWLAEILLRRLLANQGYPLEIHDLRDYMVYLQDREIGCTETKKENDLPPFLYKYRITAKGVRALEGDQKVPGIGLSGDDED